MDRYEASQILAYGLRCLYAMAMSVRDNKLYSSFALEPKIERGITDIDVCLMTCIRQVRVKHLISLVWLEEM